MFKKLLLICLLTPLSIFALLGQKKLQKSIYFEANKAVLTEFGENALFQLIDTSRYFKTYKIGLFGSIDRVGNVSSNKKLAEKRVNVVRDYLIKNGIAKEHVAIAIESENNIEKTNAKDDKTLTQKVEIVVDYLEIETPSVSEAKNEDKIPVISSIDAEDDLGIPEPSLKSMFKNLIW